MNIPETGLSEQELGERLHRAREKDTPFLSGRVLGSMCTAPHPASVETFRLFLDTNLGDPLINPGVVELRDEALEMLGDLVGAGPRSGGLFLSGGSEANFTALRLARDTTGRREVVMPRTAHFSFRKAAHALGMRVVETGLTETFEADVEDIKEAVTSETACVIGVAGNTEFGAVDDIEAIGEVGEDQGAWVHVDAAYGGFILPYLPEPVPFGLDVDGVSSVTIDPHKMGRAAIPAGCLFVEDEEVLMEGATRTPYVSTERQAGLLSTRPGAAAASMWAALNAIGHEGYRIQARSAVEIAEWFGGVMENKGATLIRKPGLGIVSLAVEENVAARELLAEEGWKVSLTTIVPGIRIVCMPHVTTENLTRFVEGLPNTLEVDDGRILHA